MTTSYSASGIKPKRTRRTASEVGTLEREIFNILWANHPMTVRQVFYQLVKRNLIPKLESEYQLLVKRLVKMRITTEVPYSWIADGTRWQRKPTSYDSLSEALEDTLQTYRRSIWTEQRSYIEFWLEKDALASVISPITYQWDIPLYVSRGFSSRTLLYNAAQYLLEQNKRCYVYVMTDYDDAGMGIYKQVHDRLHEFVTSKGGLLNVERLALTPEQVKSWNLPTRPGKGTAITDAVDLDAIDPANFRQIVTDAITSRIDGDRYQRLLAEEKLERESLEQFMSAWESKQEPEPDNGYIQ